MMITTTTDGEKFILWFTKDESYNFRNICRLMYIEKKWKTAREKSLYGHFSMGSINTGYLFSSCIP